MSCFSDTVTVNGFRIEDDGEVWGAYDAATGEHATFSDGQPACAHLIADLVRWCKCQDRGATRSARPCGYELLARRAS